MASLIKRGVNEAYVGPGSWDAFPLSSGNRKRSEQHGS